MRNQLSDNISTLNPIGFFNSNRVWGGGEKWHYSTARMMKERGLDVIVFAQSGCELIKRTRLSGISSVEVRVSNTSFLNPVKMVKMALMLKKQKIGTIILNLPSDVKFAGLAARLAGVKKIIYRRGSPVSVRNTLMNRFLFRHILTDIIANSQQIKRSILQNNPRLTDEAKITIIYNGVDGLPPPGNDSTGEPLTVEQGVVIGTAGRLSAEKGLNRLLKLACDLKEKGLEFSVLIAGDGPLMNLLKQKSHDLGLDDRVRFCGFISEMERFYDALDVFVLTSAWEGCSNVILEAMYRGLPVVAFNNSSIPEMVQDNESGYLVRNGDSRDLAEKVEKLINDPGLRKKFGNAGKILARNKYDMKTAFEQLITLVKR